MSRCAIGLGSNLGDRITHLDAAVVGLASIGRVRAVSPIYETAPIGGPEQDPFLNAVVVVDTAHTPHGLLRALLIIERGRGRVRQTRWGPRTLDLDVILWERLSISEEGLTIPHPRMAERRFVLEPLHDVWPDATMPDGTRVTAASDAVERQLLERIGVRLRNPD